MRKVLYSLLFTFLLSLVITSTVSATSNDKEKLITKPAVLDPSENYGTVHEPLITPFM